MSDTEDSPRGFAHVLFIAGIAALLVATWSLAGGTALVGGAKLLGGIVIAVVALAGILLIVRPGGRRR
ncbi:hypothetical protein [Tsukamurella soli]|uniref:Uncharacterized protein n=1 Tax=Tsukamurella soli TaxID=644556 RepID=A0ABP8KFL5_9ACTN